jgi:AraC-like DNA-binding protein
MQLTSSNSGPQLALVQLPGRMRRAVKLFHKITGLTAVTSLATVFPEAGTPLTLSPPVHPQCAKRLRSISAAPCAEQWRIHVRSTLGRPRAHTHTCPIGLRCSCVPVLFGDQIVGVAKLVVDSGTSERTLESAINVLKLVVSETCQSSTITVLSEALRESRQRLAELQHVHAGAPPGTEGADVRNAALVDRALAHLQRHHSEPTFSLRTVAAALECNPRYLTTRFSKIVGERMHTHLVGLRVAHACRLLMETELHVKEVAFASGFSGAGRMDSAFRRHVGVSPGTYRRIFAAP